MDHPVFDAADEMLAAVVRDPAFKQFVREHTRKFLDARGTMLAMYRTFSAEFEKYRIAQRPEIRAYETCHGMQLSDLPVAANGDVWCTHRRCRESEELCEAMQKIVVRDDIWLRFTDEADEHCLGTRCTALAVYRQIRFGNTDLWPADETQAWSTLNQFARQWESTGKSERLRWLGTIDEIIGSVVDEFNEVVGRTTAPETPGDAISREALRALVNKDLAGVVSAAANASAALRANASMNRLLDEDESRCDWRRDDWIAELRERGERYSSKTIQATGKLKDGAWRRCLALRESRKNDRRVSKETGENFLLNEAL